jgi:hypothetical protein
MTNNNQNILCMCTIVVDFEVKSLGFLRENNLNNFVRENFICEILERCFEKCIKIT